MPYFITPDLPGDFNHDGNVDTANYVVWRKRNGSQTEYTTWRSNFGQHTGSGATFGENAAAPKPSTWVLLVIGCAELADARRKSVPHNSI